jgi:hypothetical protein
MCGENEVSDRRPKHGSFSVEQRATVNRCLDVLFGPHAFSPTEDPRALGFLDLVDRLVPISEQHGGLYLQSREASEARKLIANTFVDANIFGNAVVRSDVRNALGEILHRCYSRSERPVDSGELKSLLLRRLLQEVDDRTFMMPLRGVSLSDIEQLQIGLLHIVSSAEKYISARKLKHSIPDDSWIWRSIGDDACLVGTFRGTLDAASKRYEKQALLSAGLLAIYAGCTFLRGSTQFKIGVDAGLPNRDHSSVYLHWRSGGRPGGFSVRSRGKQKLEIGSDRLDDFSKEGLWKHGFQLLEHESAKSDLVRAIRRAIYWYGDAHRDSTAVMQFVKYWSCLECLFGIEERGIAESIAIGLTVVLTFGPLPLLDPKDYSANRAKVKRAYDKRSVAVHQAQHEHVVYDDLVDLSTWAAFATANMIAVSAAGHSDRKKLLEQARSINDKFSSESSH